MVTTSAQATIHIFEVIFELDKDEIKAFKSPVGLKNYSRIKVANYEDFDKHNNNSTINMACRRKKLTLSSS